MTILRVRSVWSNWAGAPGITDLYTRDLIGTTMAAAVRAFWDAVKASLPTGLTIQVLGTADQINEVNGQLTGSSSFTAPAPVVGTNAGGYAGGSGVVVNWITNGFVAGRRVRGRTFCVPVASTYDTNGSLASSIQSLYQTAANGLITANGGDFVVWSRPTDFRAGTDASVVSAIVPDLAAVLRRRRT